jgi:hypothetical protein
MAAVKLVFRAHALQRMFERGISVEEVWAVVEVGETIITYSDDTPYPSRLVLGKPGRRSLRVVYADNLPAHEIIVMTAYEPDPQQWEPDFRRRSKP